MGDGMHWRSPGLMFAVRGSVPLPPQERRSVVRPVPGYCQIFDIGVVLDAPGPKHAERVLGIGFYVTE